MFFTLKCPECGGSNCSNARCTITGKVIPLSHYASLSGADRPAVTTTAAARQRIAQDDGSGE